MQPDMIASAVHALHLLLGPTRLLILLLGVLIGLAIDWALGVAGPQSLRAKSAAGFAGVFRADLRRAI
jgi:hypothetical protein